MCIHVGWFITIGHRGIENLIHDLVNELLYKLVLDAVKHGAGEGPVGWQILNSGSSVLLLRNRIRTSWSASSRGERPPAASVGELVPHDLLYIHIAPG